LIEVVYVGEQEPHRTLVCGSTKLRIYNLKFLERVILAPSDWIPIYVFCFDVENGSQLLTSLTISGLLGSQFQQLMFLLIFVVSR
jgi:hypothetical protein